jgi:tetratricopeptide (TPR) repeat protein
MRITFIFFLFVSFIPNLTSAETKTFVKEYTYQASEDDNRNSSRTLALQEVKRLLLEELGTYLESFTEVISFLLTRDQIITLTAGIVKTEIVDGKWDGHTYWLKARIAADSAKVIESINTISQDHLKTKELEDTRRHADELLKENERLRNELATAKGDKRKKDKAAYDETIKALSAIEWVEKGKAFSANRQYSDAIDSYNKAIELDLKDERVYALSGDLIMRVLVIITKQLRTTIKPSS